MDLINDIQPANYENGVLCTLYKRSTIMKRYIVILLALVLASISLPEMSFGAENWENLFDGKTLNGWIQRNGKAKYAVEDGMIVGTTVPNTPNSFLCTEKNYTGFYRRARHEFRNPDSQPQLQELQRLPRPRLSGRDRHWDRAL